MNGDSRSYQRRLVMELRAEMGRQNVSRRELMRRTSIAKSVMDRIFDVSRDLNVTQWDAICSALGVDPGEMAARASSPSVTAHSGEDPRSLIAHLLNNPAQDETLNTRLSEAQSRSGLRGSQLVAHMETIRNVRRRELGDALRALPPSEAQGGAEFKAE